MTMATALPDFGEVLAAVGRIARHTHRTPVLTSRRVDEQVGARVFFKAENLQRTGSFKFRGACNALSRLDRAQRVTGVVTYSSGNHAQALALAGAVFGVPVTVVMPHDAPRTKVAATLGYGAEVVRYDRYSQDREAIGRELARGRGLTLIPPYDHRDVIAGQGTAALELLEEVGELDLVLTPLGGGGLLSGTALAVRGLAPDAQVYGVEPVTGDDGRQSLEQGHIVHIDPPVTIADGAQTTHLGELTYPILAAEVAGVVTATDGELIEAMRLVAGTLKVIIEPTAALGVAAVLAHRVPVASRRVGVVLTGGNVDVSRYAELLGAPHP